MDAPDEHLPWYAIHVRSNFERIVHRHLQEKGYHPFLPTYSMRRQWSDRVKQMDVPLFPGYVFCRLDPDNRMPVITTPGVVKLVGHGKTPVAISKEEIDAVQRILTSQLPYLPWPSMVLGQHVAVDHGPLMGLQGVLLECRPPHRLAVSVTMVNRAVTVEVDAAWIRPLKNSVSSGSNISGIPHLVRM